MRSPLLLIAGPCVIETKELTFNIAGRLKDLSEELGVDLVFKASFDKANRTSLKSFRGPGMARGLALLAQVKKKFGVRVLTDVHECCQVRPAAKVVDALQIPAFLCRQTDLILAACKTGKTVNIKKGQFLAPWDMDNIVAKASSTGNKNIWLTERGSCFGYNRLVVDMVSLAYLKKSGCKVVFDLTHSLQLPGELGGSTGGQKEFASALARAASGAGIDGLFIEVHPDPKNALSDAATSLNFNELRAILKQVLAIQKASPTGVKL